MNYGGVKPLRGLFLWIAPVALLVLCCQNIQAQQSPLYGDETNTRQWPRLFQNRASDGIDKPKPISFPKLGLFRNVAPNESGESRTKVFSGFSRLLPERDPERPRFFEEMNIRSKDFFNRTSTGFTDWASRTNDNARTHSSDAWDNITNSMKKPTVGFDQKTPSTNQPPVRSAKMIAIEPPVKF